MIANAVQHAATLVAAADRIKTAGSLRQIAKTNLALVSCLKNRAVRDGRKLDQTLRWPLQGPMLFRSSLTEKILAFFAGDL
jgi:hypothetical protein